MSAIIGTSLQNDDELTHPTTTARSTRLTHEIERIEATNNGEIVSAMVESRSIVCAKRLVFCILLAIASVMTWAVYSLAFELEQRNFERTFESEASRLVETFHQKVVLLLLTGAAVTASLACSAVVISNNTSPFVTLPCFERTVGYPAQMVHAQSFSWAPLLKSEEARQRWDDFVKLGLPVANTSLSEGLPETSTESDDWEGTNIVGEIFEFHNELGPVRSESGPPYSPIWQSDPISKTNSSIMFNQISESKRAAAIHEMGELGGSAFTGFLDAEFERMIAQDYSGQRSILFTPLYREKEIVGSSQLSFDWLDVFSSKPGVGHPLVVVLQNTCGEIITFLVDGSEVAVLGDGDLHLRSYDKYERASSFERMQAAWLPHSIKNEGDGIVLDKYFQSELPSVASCRYSIRVYPDESFSAHFYTHRPTVYAALAALAFLFCLFMMHVYNRLVEKRQTELMLKAVDATNIVDSMFPIVVRDRLLRNRRQIQDATGSSTAKVPLKISLARMLRSSASSYDGDFNRCILGAQNKPEEPIATIFSNTTVIFADIAGFTAWSSEREPCQVFELLETLYRNFDAVAKRLGVFKVETIGDCYVAVTGLPESNKDHAIVCARFAWEVLHQTSNLTKALEVSLGPGTSDLQLRVGLHSGAVTAGVLRGEKARFQLFGDTMNTASRMESTGQAGKIQVSPETAGLLISSGKERWLSKREELVAVKGKGDMQLYWLEPQGLHTTEAPNSVEGDKSEDSGERRKLELESPAFLDASGKLERLIDWNVEVLMSRLAKVVAKRNIMVGLGKGPVVLRENAPEGHLLESVSDVIEMPRFDPRIARHRSCNAGTTSIINQAVRSQLRAYVSRIARCYKDVPFHNFEHASHVALSANKLIKRIISPKGEDYTQDKMDCERMVSLASDLHHSTSGISSDPLTQFAVVFAALVHDVDHAGVPNAQLVKEEDPIAVRYKHKSVAEQNSVQLALGILCEHRYIDLQNCIFANSIERSRFQQLVINSVMATDIVDKELRSLRADRWAKAFYGTDTYREKEEVTNHKAAIVIEHIIQASDVAHTMQHWHVFCKWNEKLYHEMYAAYLAGRSSKDPTVDWYENEIAFFDHYVIPLAQKLKQCGVFGLSSDEYLQYALANRREWVSKGQQVTKAIITRRISIYGDDKSERTRPSIAPIIQPGMSSVSSDGHSDDP